MKEKKPNKGKFIAYFSLINGYPVCGGKPFVTSDVPNTILKITIAFCQIHL